MPKLAKASVWMGNTDTKGGYIDPKTGELVPTHEKGNRVWAMGLPSSEAPNAFVNITDPTRGAWQASSWKDPAWVVSDDERLEQLLAAHYQCPAGVPKDIDKWQGGASVPRRKK